MRIEALRMIFQRGEYIDTSIPDMIITDVDSYRTEVRWEFLYNIAKREDIKCIPTVIELFFIRRRSGRG